MSSLYRKYRPKVFLEIVGQDRIRSSLEAAVKQDNVGHAYLFSGPRGTGKTTTARLLARAINCQAKSGDKPCNKCAVCLEVGEGRFTSWLGSSNAYAQARLHLN